MNTVVDLVISPLGPALLLTAGALVQLVIGRRLRRPGWLTGLALFFVGAAGLLLLWLRFQPVVPIFSRPWQPLLQRGANLLWVGDGWNWYISGLVLLLGGLGILLELNTDRSVRAQRPNLRLHANLAVHLAILGASLLFVSGGNLLTVVLTWVVVDILVLLRSAVRPEPLSAARPLAIAQESRAKGLSLIGALLLLVALLVAGPEGPGQPLQGGVIPMESALLLLIAAVIRAGIYPFHLWLMPNDIRHVDLAERLLDHVVPVLGGLWLLGWATQLGAQYFLMRPALVGFALVALLGSALTAWTAREQPYHTTFVLVASAGLSLLVGVLAYAPGPSTLIWPTTVFALGGGLWLVGERAWEGWGWQLPVSVGALALAGLPFTPGFLAQPALSRMLTTGGLFLLFFGVFAVAQGLQISAMLRSWGRDQRLNENITLRQGDTMRLLIASVALGLPLAVVGFLPRAVAALANLPDAIPPLLGSPPIVVAETPVWITLILPMAMGIGLVWLRPFLWQAAGPLFDRMGRFARLEWLFDLSWWGVNQGSNIWGNALRVVEGPGYIGWAAVFALIGYLLIR